MSTMDLVNDPLKPIMLTIPNDSTPVLPTLLPSLPMQSSLSPLQPSRSRVFELPWEVIERVIEHSADSSATLRSFTLTCRDLRPRSTMLLLCRVKIEKRDQIFHLRNMLQAKPHLTPCVRSVSIPFQQFSPNPLLQMLPNLSKLKLYSQRHAWTQRKQPEPKGILLPSSVLHSCHQLGQHIQTLSLHNITFRSLSDFSATLLSFRAIKSLSCTSKTRIEDRKSDQGSGVPEGLITRLSEKLRLSTLTVGRQDSNKLFILLVEAQKHILESLTCTIPSYENDSYATKDVDELSKLTAWASLSGWDQLTSFTWTTKLEEEYSDTETRKYTIRSIIEILKKFNPAKLQEFTIVFKYDSLQWQANFILPTITKQCTKLEKTLITKFPAPAILFSQTCSRDRYRSKPLNSRRYHSWINPLSKFFPVLAERGALRIDADFSGHAGHDGHLCTPMVISADSRWAATGSEDHTIIIWDLESQCIYQEWFIEGYEVDDLAFSPDSQYVMSVGGRWEQEATIWDFHQGASGRKVRSLAVGPGFSILPYHDTMRCAWSPDGRWIAVGSHSLTDGATHIWDKTTFPEHLHAHTTWKGILLAVSSDGCWVVTAIKPPIGYTDIMMDNCWIWNAASGKLHRSLLVSSVCAAAFDLGGTRVLTATCATQFRKDPAIYIWDVGSGKRLLVLQVKTPINQQPEEILTEINSVAFSGDGRMVLSLGYPDAMVWDASSGALLTSFSGLCTTVSHYTSVHYARFSPCGRYLALRSWNGEVQLWRIRDWSCIAKVSSGGAAVTHVTFSPNGRYLCYGTRRGTVFFSRMDDLISSVKD